MTDKRSGSQQRRANQNKAARQSLAARKAAADRDRNDKPKAARGDQSKSNGQKKSRPAGDTPEAVAPDAVTNPDGTDDGAPRRGGLFGGGGGGGLLGGGGGGLFGGGRAARQARVPLGPSPIPETDGGVAGFLQAIRLVRGAPLVLASVILALISVVVFGFIISQPASLAAALADVATDKAPQLVAQTPAERFGAFPVAIFLGFPAVISAVALSFLLRPQRRRAWFIASIVQGVWILFSGGGLGLLVAGLMWFGTYQTTKAERLAAAAG